MFFSGIFDNSLWWIFPLVMMVLCFLMMQGRMGLMCGFRSQNKDNGDKERSESAVDILDKRYARGDINREEYEEHRRVLSGS